MEPPRKPTQGHFQTIVNINVPVWFMSLDNDNEKNRESLQLHFNFSSGMFCEKNGKIIHTMESIDLGLVGGRNRDLGDQRLGHGSAMILLYDLRQVT